MSKIKVDAIESRSGNSLTFGASTDTITLGASAFNGTSSVIWDTTAKTSGFTAVAGTGYFVDTSSSAVTATLPASPSAGDVVAFKDYAESFATNNLTIARNGSPIAGETADALITTNKASIVMVYVDGTKGWLFTMESNIGNLLPQYVAATGGTITTSGDYKIHTFTSSGTFTVTNAGSPTGSNTVDYMVVAGGGAGGSAQNRAGGGGGAGGFRESVPNPSAWTASPIANSGGSLPVSVQGYPITVGGGGSGGPSAGGSGSNSVFSTITSAGGGGAAAYTTPGSTGGSGGGGSLCRSGSAGNTPPVSPPQGNSGGNGINPGSAPTEFGAGGGGGALASGGNAGTAPGSAGDGGGGATTSISASPTAYAGGGGGGAEPQGNAYTSGGGGVGGGGAGAEQPNSNPAINGTAGTTNTGGGGGGAAGGSGTAAGGGGGSGIVIIRYKFQ